MNTRYDDTATSYGRSNTIAAIFATEKSARDAIKNLHKAGFKQTWLGKTRENDLTTGEPTVEGGNDAWARFLSAGDDRRPLHRVLMERGLTESQARTVEDEIAPGCLVITVYAEDNPQGAAEILADDNGDVIDAGAERPRAVDRASRARRERDRIPAQRGDYFADDASGADEGYVIEEFIATGADRDAYR
jgi:hypothetical protein